MRSILQLSLLVPLSLTFGCSDKTDDAEDTGVDSSPPPNTAPVAVDDSAETWSGLEVEIDVLDNDDDEDNDGLDITEISQPENGFVQIVSVGQDSVAYTSDGTFVGVDTFTYTVNDGNGGTDSATVAVNVISAPTLQITAPTESEEVGGPEITIEFEVNGCNVSYPSQDAAGCHVHKYLDGEIYKDEDDSGFGHYEAAPFTISPVEAGEHSFTLYLISNDGSDSPFDPLIEDTVTFTVTPALEN